MKLYVYPVPANYAHPLGYTNVGQWGLYEGERLVAVEPTREDAWSLKVRTECAR